MGALGDARRAWQGLAAKPEAPVERLLPRQPIPDLLIACVTVYIKGGWGSMKKFLDGEGVEPGSEVGQALMAGAAGMATAWRLVAQGLGTTVEAQWESAMLFRARARS